jgi:hypothetical protein
MGSDGHFDLVASNGLDTCIARRMSVMLHPELPFSSEKPKAEDYHHFSYYDAVQSDHEAENTVLADRTEVVSALEFVQRGLAETIPGELTLSTMNIATLKDKCKKEINQFQSGKLDTDKYCTELLRRVTLQGDQDAWHIVQQLFAKIVRGWIECHPQKEVARDLESEEIYVTQAFTLFKQTIIHQQVKFTALTDMLHYLRASLNGAILDRLRAFSRPQVNQTTRSAIGQDGEGEELYPFKKGLICYYE